MVYYVVLVLCQADLSRNDTPHSTDYAIVNVEEQSIKADRQMMLLRERLYTEKGS